MKRDNCKNCKSPLTGKFCSSCGQKAYTDKDKSISNLLQEAFHFMTHFEGKFFKTIITIYRYPGKLSMDYCNGIRQHYYKPISLYLLIVILYLLFPLASGMNMEMKHYKGSLITGKYISNQIENKIIKNNITEEQLSEKFHEKSKNTSKFLLLLLIPLSAPMLYLLYIRKKRYLFDNYILLTEINIFFLLTFFILIPVIFLPVIYFFDIILNDTFFTPFFIILFTCYCILLLHKVFKEKWWISVLKGGIFGIVFMLMIVVIYRTIVFETTFALI